MERQGEGSNYRSDYTNDQLYKLVRKAAFKLSPTRPVKLSTRRFDAGREALDEPDAPSAKWIAKRLGHPWPELVKVVCNSERDTTMTDSAARRAPQERWLDKRHLYFALRYVAKILGKESFNAFDYDTTREQLLKAEQHNPKGDGPLRIILPTSGQIIQIVRRIEKAEAEAAGEALADLDAANDGSPDGTKAAKPTKNSGKKSKKATKKTRELLPDLDEDSSTVEALDEAQATGYWNKALVLAELKPYEQSRQLGIDYVTAIHHYIEATGKLPGSVEEVKRFASVAGFSLSRPDKGNSVKAYLPETASLRSSLGLPMVDEIARSGKETFDLSKLPTDLPKPVRQHWAGKDDAIIDALCEYLDTVKARNIRQPNQDDYQETQRGRRNWPSASTLDRVEPGSFTAWIGRAQIEWKNRQQKVA